MNGSPGRLRRHVHSTLSNGEWNTRELTPRRSHLPTHELTWRQYLDAQVAREGQQVSITAHNRLGVSGHSRSQNPVVVRITAHRIGERRRLAPSRVLTIQRKDGQVVRSQTELTSECRHEFVPKHLRQNRIVLGHVNLEDLPAKAFRHDAADHHVRVEDKSHEMSANTSSSVKIPLALARGTATRRAWLADRITVDSVQCGGRPCVRGCAFASPMSWTCWRRA